MGFKVNLPSTEELRQMAVQRLGAPMAPGITGLTEEQTKRLVDELAISRIDVEIQNVYLQETCARLDVALNEITDMYDFAPMGCFSIDAAGKISRLNLAGASLFVMERNILVGRVMLEFFFPEQREHILELMRRATASSEDQQCDASLLGHNRLVKKVQLALSHLSSTVCHHIGLTDISGRKLLENDLRSNEERWMFALDSAGDGVWVWD